MQISIYQDGNVIGTAILEHLDPPMGVAFGPFSPVEQYDRDQHANTVEGEYIADRGQSLSVVSDPHGRLETASIAIEDWSDPQLGMQLTVWFKDGHTFAALFSAHADYRAYYDR
ncbi:hypothetical protein ACWIEX_11145 [Bosea sp. NPDC055353]